MSVPIARSTVSSAMLISRTLEVGREVLDRRLGRRVGGAREDAGIGGAPGDVGVKLYDANVTRVVGQRARDDAVARTAVVDAPAAAHDRRVRAVDVVGEADARSEVVLVLVERHRRGIRGVAGELDAVRLGRRSAAGTADTRSAGRGSASELVGEAPVVLDEPVVVGRREEDVALRSPLPRRSNAWL